jgi:putative pyruvate formate lyase activating enzyme
MDLFENYRACRLCPRECSVNRLGSTEKSRSGFCRESHQLRVAYVGPHFGEEPPLTGTQGSGTVFFTGCSLRCSFCQNYQISRDGFGQEITVQALVDQVANMIRDHRVHNVNLVTPDHFLPHVAALVTGLREEGYDLPVVMNLSGYQSLTMLRMSEGIADIYLPDFKYADPHLSATLSKCRDYREVALQAISEMVRQKGFLDSFEKGTTLATSGVLVRHLVLPGKVENSIHALTTLFLEFGPHLPLSLMSQYTTVMPNKDQDLNRPLRREEFDTVYSHAADLGFECLFVQFPDEGPTEKTPFLPDFQRDKPFSR